MPGAHPCPGSIDPEGPRRAIPAQGPSMPKAHSSRGHMGGPSMPKAHLCPGPIHLEGSWWPSMPRAHPCPWHIHPQDPLGPIHAEGPSLPSAHPSRGIRGSDKCTWHPQNPLGPIHAEGPFQPNAYPSRGLRGPHHKFRGPSLPRAHPRAHEAQLCRGS